MILPENVLSFLNVFKNQGFSAYVVGGAVRDFFIGTVNSDFDIATSAKPEQIKSIFAEYKTIDTGIKHGTVTVIFNGQTFEVTTFRVDGDYKDNRHPDSVVFTDRIGDDLSRRDFTMNAIAYSPEIGIVDNYNGVKDIENKIIRAVGNASERFKEDALRILRAVRFSAKTGFSIEENTYKAMLLNKSLLKSVSVERIFDELTKTLLCKNCRKALMEYKEIIFEVIPELIPCDGFDQKNKAHVYDVYEHTLYVLENLERRTATTCWAALLHDIGKPYTLTIDEGGVGHFPKHMEISAKIAEEVLKRLKAPNVLLRQVTTIISVHDKEFYAKYAVKKFMNKFGAQTFEDFLTLTFADVYAHSVIAIEKYLPERKIIARYYKEILNRGECFNLSHLAIGGDKLLELGFNGESIGKVLDELLDLVMKEEIHNDEKSLIAYIKEKY